MAGAGVGSVQCTGVCLPRGCLLAGPPKAPHAWGACPNPMGCLHQQPTTVRTLAPGLAGARELLISNGCDVVIANTDPGFTPDATALLALAASQPQVRCRL